MCRFVCAKAKCKNYSPGNAARDAKERCHNISWIIFLPYLEAQKLVEDMEKERRKLDKQLDLVQEKTKRAYLSQEILEAKMKVTKQDLQLWQRED